MKKILSTAGVLGSLYLVPFVAFADPTFANLTALGTLILTFINNTLVPLVFAISILVFLWGVFKYFILGGADEAKRAEGKQLMLYAVVALVVMVSIWGIVNFFATTLGLRQPLPGSIPDVPLTNT